MHQIEERPALTKDEPPPKDKDMRTYRAPEDLYRRAFDAAKANGEHLAAVIRDLLEEYAGHASLWRRAKAVAAADGEKLMDKVHEFLEAYIEADKQRKAAARKAAAVKRQARKKGASGD